LQGAPLRERELLRRQAHEEAVVAAHNVEDVFFYLMRIRGSGEKAQPGEVTACLHKARAEVGAQQEICSVQVHPARRRGLDSAEPVGTWWQSVPVQVRRREVVRVS